MKVFRPSIFLGLLFAFICTPFALIGVAGVTVGILEGRTWQDWDGYLFFCFFYLMGSFLALGGIALCAYRIKLDAVGMSRCSWFGIISYFDSWDSLKSWTTGKIEDSEMPGRCYVEFDFRYRRWPFRIEAMEVACPGFQEFLGEIRSHVGSKEVPGVKDIQKRY